MKSNVDLKAHIDLVGREFQSSSAVRAIAGASGITSGALDPEALFEHCQQLIGYDANFEGYLDGYIGDPTWEELPEEEPLFGYGIPFTSYEAYIELHEHFGDNWLSLTLRAWLLQSGTRPTEVMNQVDTWMTSAKTLMLETSIKQYTSTVGSLNKHHAEALRKAADRLNSSVLIAA